MLAEYQESKEEMSLESKSRTLAFNKRVLTNSRAASRACNLFSESIKPLLLRFEVHRCTHSQIASKDLKMGATGRSRFMSAFYQMLRYSAMLQRTSRPRELRLEQLPSRIFFPMIRLSMWSCSLETSILEELLNLITPGTFNGRSEENNVHSSHPWMKICRSIEDARSRRHVDLGTPAICSLAFLE